MGSSGTDGERIVGVVLADGGEEVPVLVFLLGGGGTGVIFLERLPRPPVGFTKPFAPEGSEREGAVTSRLYAGGKAKLVTRAVTLA